MSVPHPSRDSGRVRAMFGAIAHRYDLLNHVLSLNLDRSWRRRAARELPEDPSARILDLCCGTGDLSVALVRAGCAGTVICCDFSHQMLLLALPKLARLQAADRCLLLEADGHRLPLASETFDAVTVAFGVRNFTDMDAAFREIHRLLKPSGRLVVLEFSTPTAPIVSSIYRFYLMRVLPRVGDLVARQRGPYFYLAQTISQFPDPVILAHRIREAGFASVAFIPLTGGIVHLHTALKACA